MRGPTLIFEPTLRGGNGFSGNMVFVPPSQNPNLIADGLSYSVTVQPSPLLGSTVVKSPGSSPTVVGRGGVHIPSRHVLTPSFICGVYDTRAKRYTPTFLVAGPGGA